MSVTQLRTDGTLLINTSNSGGLLDTAPSTTTINVGGGINSSVTAITVTSGTGIVTGTYITIQAEGANTTETVLVTGGGGTTGLTVTRAQLSTAASAHANGATVTVPGKVIVNLLTIAQSPNTELFIRKVTSDVNYVEVTATGGNLFPNGSAVTRLTDSSTNSTAHIKFPAVGNTLLLLASGGAGGGVGAPGPTGPAGPSATPPSNVTITAFSLSQDVTPDGGLQPTFHLSVTPPSPLGTFLGCHLYLEYPDQSGAPSFAVGTGVIGTDAVQGPWSPYDLGLFQYSAPDQPWLIPLSVDVANAIRDLAGAGGSGTVARMYAPSYSDTVDNPLVRATSVSPTPSPSATTTVTLAPVRAKPQSGSNITPLTVTAVTASVLPTVLVGGILKRPISIGVDLTGLPAYLPDNWGYQLLGYKDNDLSKDPMLISGQYTVSYTTSDPAPAGPDGITVPHTFGEDEPSVVTSVTVYAVAGLFRDNPVPGRTRPRGGGPMVWTPNNIVPGHTASVTISIGTVTGVVDLTKFIAANVSPVFGNVNSLFDVLPLSMDNSRQGLLAIKALNLDALAVTNPKLALLAVDAAQLANSAATATKIANAAVGTVAIANAAITNALLANLAVGTANIQDLAVTDAKVNSLSVSKLLAGTVSVAISLTAPTITVTGSGYTINLDSTNGFKVSGNNTETVITNATDSFNSWAAGLKVKDISGGTSLQTTVSPLGFAVDNYSASLGIVFAKAVGTGAVINLGTTTGSGAQVELRTTNIPRILLSSSVGNSQITVVGQSQPFISIASTDGSTPYLQINGNIGYTGSLASAISGGRNVIGGIIY